MKTITNKNEDTALYFDGNGALVVANSTEQNQLITECVPDRKRKQILQSALDQADLDDDVVFVTAWESLMGYYTIQDS